jgi:hypothetical protein
MWTRAEEKSVNTGLETTEMIELSDNICYKCVQDIFQFKGKHEYNEERMRGCKEKKTKLKF